MTKIRGGWKEGLMSDDLKSIDGIIYRKNQLVRYKRYRRYDNKNNNWTGGYEWRYMDLNNNNLMVSRKFLIIT